jgi:release factor glutamine methyltransferase
VVSNPPYIPTRELASLQPEVSDHEPRMALDGGADGLDYYRRLFADAGSVLNDDGFVAVEVGLGQSSDVASIAREASFHHTESVADLAGVERVVVATR